MAGCSNTTSIDFQFPVFISIVHTIVVFCFQEKEKMFQKTKKKERSKHAQNMDLWSAKIGSNMIKTWAKESKDIWFKHAQNLDQQRRKKNQL